jgi:Carboxypeptidase regulatory-like domain/TonB dependent receptor
MKLTEASRSGPPAALFWLCLIILADQRTLFGQTTTGAILGQVTDRTGATLQNVSVAVINDATGSRRIAITDEAGRYEVPLLPPGDYRIEADLQGFTKAVTTGIHLQVNQRALIHITLQIGALQQQVVVTAGVPLVDTESAAVGTVIDNSKLVELPLNGREFFQLSTLVTGALPPAQGSQNSMQGGAVSINGAREQSNTFLLDGIDNTYSGISQVVVPVSVDSVQEFKVQSSTYNAEFGRSGGGQFNYVSRRGTNQWRGSVYEFFRNAALDAKNFFDDPNREIPQFQRNQFGGTLGGPLRKNTLFVFGNYEGTRIREAFTRITTVPPLAWRRGDFSSLLTGALNPQTGLDQGQLYDPRTRLPISGNIVPDSLIDSAGAAILGFYPPPDDPSAGRPSPATVAPVGPTDTDQFTIRVDQTSGARHQLFYRYSQSRLDRFDVFDPIFNTTNVPGFGAFASIDGVNLGAGWTWSVGSRAVNEFRIGFNRRHLDVVHEHQGDDVSARLGIEGLSRDPRHVGRPAVVVGVTDPLSEIVALPQEFCPGTFQIAESLSWIRGRHSFKTGLDLRQVREDGSFAVFARGQFIFVGLSGNPIADLLMGVPAVALRQNPEKNADFAFRTTSVSGFLQDDWQVTRDLTLNLGIRYDLHQPLYDSQNRLSVPDLENLNGGFIKVGTRGIPRAGYDADKNNLAPRAGLAWAPERLGRTVLRGGYGVSYDAPVLDSKIFARTNPPQFGLDLRLGPPSLRHAFDGPAIPIPVVRGVDREFRDAYYHQWSVNMQQELAPNLLLDVAYVGSAGRNLARYLDPNQGPPGGPPVRNPNFGPATILFSSAASEYHSLQARIERRFVGGWSLLSAYTWSRSYDDVSAHLGSAANGGTGAPQNSFDPLADWGPSDFDTPQRWVVSYIWDLPFGRGRRWLDRRSPLNALLDNWTVTGITAFQSGRPFTVYYGASANYSRTSNGANGGPGLDRPNLAGSPQMSDPKPSMWFDPRAFTPPDGTFGNVGRNTLRGDGLQNFDVGIYKNLRVRAAAIQLRMEIFNAFNTANFFLPVGDLTSANAGRIVRAHDARQIQLGAKVRF